MITDTAISLATFYISSTTTTKCYSSYYSLLSVLFLATKVYIFPVSCKFFADFFDKMKEKA